MTGGYLRTNWRNTQSVLNTEALAQGFQNASLIGSAGANYGYPLVYFSTSGTVAAGGLSVGAYSVLSAFFGSTVAQVMGSGHKILPIQLMHRMLVVSDSMGNMWFSISTSDTSVIMFYCRDGSISDVSFSYDMQFAGFIVSTP